MTILTTDRLVLRRPAPRDLPTFVAFYATDRSSMNGGPLTPGRAWRAFGTQLGAWEMNGFGMFAITLTGDDRIRGLVGPWFPGDWPEREIGWALFDPADEGHGFALRPPAPRWPMPSARSAGRPRSATSTRPMPARGRWPNGWARGSTPAPPRRRPTSRRWSTAIRIPRPRHDRPPVALPPAPRLLRPSARRYARPSARPSAHPSNRPETPDDRPRRPRREPAERASRQHRPAGRDPRLHPRRAVQAHPGGRPAEGRTRPAALGSGARGRSRSPGCERLAVEADLDPEFAREFLGFVIEEVIRHHKKIKG